MGAQGSRGGEELGKRAESKWVKDGHYMIQARIRKIDINRKKTGNTMDSNRKGPITGVRKIKS